MTTSIERMGTLMTPGVPSHGFDCRTRTYRTRCWICDEWVFYFECTHGSRLLFDELGEPWPIHDHRGLPFDQKRKIAIKKVGKAAAEQYIAREMMAVSVDATYGRRIQTAYRKTVVRSPSPSPQPQILREDAYPDLTVEELGIVRELIPEVDLYDRYGIPRTSIAAAALGELGTHTFAQLTVHTGALGETDNYSYTFLIERRRLATAQVRRDMVVRCSLRGVAILEHETLWVCDKIELAI